MIMGKKTSGIRSTSSIGRKITVVVGLFGFAVILFYTIFTYVQQRKAYIQSVDDKLSAAIYSAHTIVGDSFHESITDQNSVTATQDRSNILQLKGLAESLDIDYLYSMILVNGKVYYTSCSATDQELATGKNSTFYSEYKEASDIFKNVFITRKRAVEESTDADGSFRSLMVPFTTSSGKVYVVGADMPLSKIEDSLRYDIIRGLLIGFGILSAFMFFLLIIIKKIVTPIKELTENAERISAGNTEISFSVEANDETGRLSDALMKMLQNLKSALSQLEEEKAGIQRKVEQAVRESEEQKKYLQQNIGRILPEMKKFSEGDLTVGLQAEKTDSIGLLITHFNKSVEELGKMIRAIGQSTDTMAQAVYEIMASTDNIASSAGDQSQELNTVTSSIDEMAASIAEFTEEINLVLEAANSAGQKAASGGKTIENTINSIQVIANVVNKSAVTIEALGKSSDQIGDIISVIEEIADQTNLLALNAAIEAARAGEQGRGFAVVADEVRKLAERTTKATKEIASMIKNIQADTQEAVEVIITGTSEVEKGMKLANESGTVLKAIIQESDKVSEITGRVTQSAHRMTTEASNISGNIDLINSNVQESATSTEQIAHAASDLNKLAGELQTAVKKFRLGDGKHFLGNSVIDRQIKS